MSQVLTQQELTTQLSFLPLLMGQGVLPLA